MRMLRRLAAIRGAICLLASLLTGIATGQDVPVAPDLTPPPIEFPAWREVARFDTSVEYDVSFPSAFVSPYPENNVVPLRIFLPTVGSAPFRSVLITHYWGATDLRAEVSLAGELTQRGIAAVIVTLPYHLSRTPAGRRSGEMAIQPDPVKLRETMRQAALDVRRSLDFMATRPELAARPLGIAGTSLGAIVSALAYALDDRITHASFVVGGVDMAGIVWNSSRVIPQRDALRRQGWTEGSLRTELAAVEPLTYLPRTAPGRAFIVAAKYDTVVPGSATDKLESTIPDHAILRLDTGHYGGIFVQRRILREVSEFFATEFSGVAYRPPSRVWAPSIRLGVSLDPVDGLDVGAGIDVYTFDREGRLYASVFLTPRGFSLRLSRDIWGGFAIGIIAGPRKATLGLMWSTVL